ncbi:MAG: chemotaxis response regulator protein-glutamate methylesterase [Acidobacteriia bacterium]|nr:chemotaxis response regulator protein-glutamate methylesterase [Terriglobia bacterium]
MSPTPSHSPVRVLIADDSSFMRAALARMVESDDSLRVVGTARDGLEAIAQIDALQPDVVTLDLDMPGLSGLETLKRVMSESPRPVIIVSGLARRGAEDTLTALELGAFDCVAKRLSYDYGDVVKVQEELVNKIKTAAHPNTPATRLRGQRDGPSHQPASAHLGPAVTAVDVPSIIAIGTSTGGPTALEQILRTLPADLPAAILIVQHMPAGFIGPLAKRLNDLSPLQVHEAQEGQLITAGHVYLAPGGQHLTAHRLSSAEVRVHLSLFPDRAPHIPSVDVMMCSVAEVFGASVMGIILTGMGDDGARGMEAIFHEGGLTVGQDEGTCVVYGMPRSCEEIGVLREVVPLCKIPPRILTALRYRKPH